MTDKQRRWFKILLLSVETGVKAITAGQRALAEDLDLAKQAIGARFDKLETQADRLETRLDWLAVLVTRIDRLTSKIDQLAASADQRAGSPAVESFRADAPAEPTAAAS